MMWSEPWLDLIWRATWQSAILLGVVVVITRSLGERIEPRWRYLLWSVVLVRLLVLATPAASWSPYNLVPTASSNAPQSPVSVTDPWLPADEKASSPLKLAVEHAPSGAERAIEPAATMSPPPAEPSTAAPMAPIEPLPKGPIAPGQPISWASVLAMVWLAGCFLCLVRLLAAWKNLQRRLSHCRPASDPSLQQTLKEACDKLSIGRRPELLVTPEPISPYIVGLWRTKIVIPESILESLDTRRKRYIVAHELAHLCRGDVWTQWIFALTSLLHWFNPLAWWTIRQMKAAREAACDDMVIQRLGDPDSTYAKTILDLAAQLQPAPLAPGLIGLLRGGNDLSQRIERLADQRPASRKRTIAGALIVAAVMLLGLTDATQPTAAVAIAQSPPNEPAEETTGVPSREKTFSITGHCYVLGTADVIEGVNVHLVAVRGLIGEPTLIDAVVTGEEGRFTFGGLEWPRQLRLDPLSYFIVADAPGHPVLVQRIYRFRDPNRGSMPFGFYAEQTTLQGRVIDAAGNPIAGAKVTRSHYEAGQVIGVGSAVTDSEGLFQLNRLPIAMKLNKQGLKSLEFYVTGDGLPKTKLFADNVPGFADFKIPKGCTLTGVVQNKAGAGQKDIVVTASPTTGGGDRHVRTGADGRFQITVPQGNYNVMVEDKNVVAAAVADLECRAGTVQNLKPFVVGAGGWLAGRIVHPETGKPVSRTKRGERIIVGLYGPARPAGQHGLTHVDDDGRFRLRVAAGDNYPYLTNLHCDRMSWDTRRKPPVVVREGETTECVLTQDVQKQPEQKMMEARKIFATLPAATAPRIQAIIAHFRKLNHTVDETETWCLMMRDLVEIGGEAVPALCDELDRTDQQRMIRRLAFALRAIDDPRAIPVLIRSIPKTLQPSMSDYGLIVEDADLAAFMQQHDLDKKRGGKYFSFGRPVREVFGALKSLADKGFGEGELFSMHRSKDARSLHLQQSRYQNVAEKWQTWWEANWQDFDVDEKYRRVNLPALAEFDDSTAPRGLEITADAQIDRSSRGWVLSPIGNKGRGKTFFMDIDTGLTPAWPKHLPREDSSPQTIAAAQKWAAGKGADLMCVARDDGEGQSPFALHGIGMKIWQIDPLDAKNLEKRLKEGKLPEGRPAEDWLMHYDAQTKQYRSQRGSCFLYLTREGGLGVITVTDFVTQARDITGAFSVPQGVGFHLGVRFDFKTVAR